MSFTFEDKREDRIRTAQQKRIDEELLKQSVFEEVAIETEEDPFFASADFSYYERQRYNSPDIADAKQKMGDDFFGSSYESDGTGGLRACSVERGPRLVKRNEKLARFMSNIRENDIILPKKAVKIGATFLISFNSRVVAEQLGLSSRYVRRVIMILSGKVPKCSIPQDPSDGWVGQFVPDDAPNMFEGIKIPPRRGGRQVWNKDDLKDIEEMMRHGMSIKEIVACYAPLRGLQAKKSISSLRPHLRKIYDKFIKEMRQCGIPLDYTQYKRHKVYNQVKAQIGLAPTVVAELRRRILRKENHA